MVDDKYKTKSLFVQEDTIETIWGNLSKRSTLASFVYGFSGTLKGGGKKHEIYVVAFRGDFNDYYLEGRLVAYLHCPPGSDTGDTKYDRI